MLVLLMDDQDERHDLVEKYLSKAGHKVLHSFSAPEALELISTCPNRIGLALLDHDLQDIVVEDNGRKYERHGVWFVREMFATIPKDRLPAEFIVHSWNIDGAKNMVADLRKQEQIATAMSFCGDMLTQLVYRLMPQ